jgi:hypothetical protein
MTNTGWILDPKNEILRRSTPQNDVGQEPPMLIPDVQLWAEKVTQIHLTAHVI